VRQAFRKEPNSDLGGGVSLFLQTPWEEIGRLKLEALREELHCFDGSNTTSFGGSFHALWCTAAMQKIQAGKTCDEYGA
jgi:hypothetical protein